MNQDFQSIQMLNTTPNDLVNQLKDAIIPELMEKLAAQFSPKEPETYLSRSETAKLLKIDQSTLFRWTKKKVLQPIYIEGKVLFQRSDIENYLNNNKIN
ncbi:helix-turn-helix domain-containing protein [Kaistella sp.]|uniref:helix-turn-helix domain-containing protein n=1 Tax=Kaistella sp. TaxID=2782235 RepID=UPI002F93B400